MKRIFCLVAAAALLLGGCGEKNSPPTQGTKAAGSGGSVATAPADYLGAMGKAQQNAVKTVDTTSLNKAI